MTSSKHTKRALLASVLSVVLCCAMLVGSTFAWFTDSASTAVNKIQSGKLDVALEMKDADGNWVSAEGKTLDFVKATGHGNEAILWEPGATYSLPAVRIVNNGNLALKYKVIFTAINGDTDLADVLEVGKIADNAFVAMKDKDNNVVTLKDVLTSTDADGFAHGNLKANGTSDAMAIALHMQETAGNDYQDKCIEGIAITVVATQDTVEHDSISNKYDKDAEYPAGKKITEGTHIINETIVANGKNTSALKVGGANTNVTITGGHYDGGNGGDNTAVTVDNGATLTIEGGEFTVGGDAKGLGNSVIYAKGGANVVIEGGVFRTDVEYDGKLWTLNCQDNSNAKITVKGGRFYKFNPSNSQVQPAGTTEIVVADGYSVVQDGDWFVVVENSKVLNGGNLTFTTDVVTTENLVPTDDIVVDLNEKTLSLANDKYLFFDNHDASISNGKISGGKWAAYAQGKDSTVNIENVTFDGVSKIAIIADSGATLNAKNVNITNMAAGGNPIQAYGGNVVLENVTATQIGEAASPWYNSVIQVVNNIAKAGSGYKITSQANLTVESGEYYGKRAIQVNAPGGNAVINGGEFEGTEYVINAEFNPQNYTDGNNFESKIVINGGSFDGKIRIAGSSILVINGGTFKNTGLELNAFSNFVADGYKVVTNADGSWTVTAK